MEKLLTNKERSIDGHVMPQASYFLYMNAMKQVNMLPKLKAITSMKKMNEVLSLETGGKVDKVEHLSHINEKTCDLGEKFGVDNLRIIENIPTSLLKRLCKFYKVDYECLDINIPDYCMKFYSTKKDWKK